MIHGSLVAIVTPFKNGKIDEDALKKLIEFQIENGTHGIVPCGTTGESPTLSHEEHEYVIELTVKAVGKRVPVVAGTGSNSTKEAIRLTRFAEQIGVDAALLVVPYYNKPTQEGLYLHFKQIASQVRIPLILYNIPGRSGVNLNPETILWGNYYIGREKKILVPLPGVLSSQILPFWASMSLRHMESPKAILAFPSLSTTLTPSLNIFSWIFRGIPTPVSRTHTVAALPSSERAPTRISPRAAVNFTAL